MSTHVSNHAGSRVRNHANSHVQAFFWSTVGKKYIMAMSAAVWTLFVLAHLSGNLLIFAGPEAFNSYSHSLVSNHLVWVARAGLLVAFLAHVFLAFKLTFENRRARGMGYALTPNGSKAPRPASKTMIFHGTMILIFLIYHIITFSLGPYYEVTYSGVVMRDLYRLVLEVFHQPAYVVWYLICLVLLGVHLSHGVGSMFQSLGFKNRGYEPLIQKISWAYGILIAAGFISLPLYVYVFAT
jgi:succinate dehydrogenase / fumarate reductase cytochrome b subunit